MGTASVGTSSQHGENNLADLDSMLKKNMPGNYEKFNYK
jgi:hypothetical protein